MQQLKPTSSGQNTALL